jgi:hypothetical protein
MEELRLDGMSDERVLERVEVLVKRANETTAELLAYLAEVDRRGLYLGEACGSLFAYCVERLHMSEAAAGKRITAARTARRFPLLFEMIAKGDVHLSGVTLLAPHLTEENHAELLARARHQSKREIEKLVAEIAPRPDVASRVAVLPRQVSVAAGAVEVAREDAQHVQAPGRAGGGPPAAVGRPAVVAPLAPRRYEIRVTVDEETHAALCQLQDLLSHQIPDRDPAAIISRALAHELELTLARKARATKKPRATEKARATKKPRATEKARAAKTARATETARAAKTARATETPRRDRTAAKRSRHIPAAACREVWGRDGGRCAFVDAKGRRCSSSRFLEYHHIHNWGRGAGHDPAEVELRCRAHNQYQAAIDYGADFIERKRGGVSAGGCRAASGS